MAFWIGSLVVAVALAIASIGCAVRARRTGQTVAAAVTVAFDGIAGWMIVATIVTDAWPTFIPQILVAATIPIVAWQLVAVRRASIVRTGA